MLLAVSLEDEASIGTFTTPFELGGSSLSVAAYRRWLRHRYATIDALNEQWGSHYETWSAIEPTSFEDVRSNHTTAVFSKWNLSRWIDWRSFMDSQFAVINARLTHYAHERGVRVPVGIVGGQQPAPYGGCNYEKMRHAVDWIESYDIGWANRGKRGES